MRSLSLGFAVSLLASVSATHASDVPNVVVSIKPLHSIASAIMEGVGEPGLVVKGASSPHSYSMRPSDAELLQNAGIIFWTGPELEAFLEKPLESLASGTLNVPLIDAEGINVLSPREGGTFEAHEHGDGHDHAHEDEHESHADHDHDHEGEAEHADHDHEDGDDHAGHSEHEHEHEADHAHAHEVDPHFWLDPENARAVARMMTETLSKADPDHAVAYEENQVKFDKRLQALEESTRAELAPISDRPFIVFHDAYQYFEKRFGLAAAGSITINPEVQPGAARIAEIEEKLNSLGAFCIFSEPQFEPKLIRTLSAQTGVKSGVLDPLGADIPEGADMYEKLISRLANDLKSCLAAS